MTLNVHALPLSKRLTPNRWDFLVFPLVIGIIAFSGLGVKDTLAPLSSLTANIITLDPANLPEYALRTTLRMLAAMVASLVFTLIYATVAAKSKRAEKILIPALDVLQSVPVLGYISFTVTFFIALFPGRVMGAELAAIFAIFTSQAWNMTFSFYQSLTTIPDDLQEVSRSFHLSGWQRFWKLEVPFAIPGLIWNMMMSMSGGWFFVVAAEAITVGNKSITLPGVGSYLALAISEHNLGAVGWVIVVMTAVIICYDQLLFRPLVAWADKFRMENTTAQFSPSSWLLNLIQRTRLIQAILLPFGYLFRRVITAPMRFNPGKSSNRKLNQPPDRRVDIAWNTALGVLAIWVMWRVIAFVGAEVSLGEVGQVLVLGVYTLLRVMLLIVIASLIWVPLGVLIGLRPRLAEKIQPLAQFLAAFPANLLFPVFVIMIVRFNGNPDIWLSPLIVLGTQWYILFNVIAGAMAYPNDYREVSANFKIRGWQWWRKAMLPGIFPYYVTGAITASGGAWNASIVSESVSWGDTKLNAHGLGSYIAQYTAAGDFPRIILGIIVMSFFVVMFNRLLWRPMYHYANNKLNAT
ncbi:ABC transporter permease [Glaciimonas immobilis]|uniref:NitT/TauT family transport system permease protein n=1 Tax=Glaciimonas immobilis TaxID=728004 RepID=A0A840RLE1_9BURK|nr:ABC transporter permease subunit [Glaciimonas immobilis]KAF3999140.1 ABC transporter permease subunit [Glaciimonas immobilis]MBB5198583.1 NitT/TauT family transport system permease protein [Glaciimonas immobilis]